MSATVIFHAGMHIDDRDPEVLTNEDRSTNRDKSFRAETYFADASWHTEGHWRWRRVGPILRLDGQPHANKSKGYVEIPIEQVPAYVLEEFHRRLVERAAQAEQSMRAWVQAARALWMAAD